MEYLSLYVSDFEVIIYQESNDKHEIGILL